MTRWQCCVLLWHGDDITKKKLMKTVSLLVQYIWNCSNWKYRMFCDKPWILLNFVLQVEIRAQASETDISGIFSYLRKKQAFLYPPPPPPPPQTVFVGGILFSGCPSVRASVCPVRDGFLFQYLEKAMMEFHKIWQKYVDIYKMNIYNKK